MGLWRGGARAEGGYGRSWALGGGAWEARRACRFSSRVIGRGVGGSVGSGGPAPSTVRLVARCCIAGLLLGSNGCLVCAGRNLCVSSVESAAGPRAECVCVCVGVGWSTMEYGVSEYHPTTPPSEFSPSEVRFPVLKPYTVRLYFMQRGEWRGENITALTRNAFVLN